MRVAARPARVRPGLTVSAPATSSFRPAARHPAASRGLLARDEALVAPGGLAGNSVAVTGFPALEQILYDDARMPSPGAPAAEATVPARWRRDREQHRGDRGKRAREWQREAASAGGHRRAPARVGSPRRRRPPTALEPQYRRQMRRSRNSSGRSGRRWRRPSRGARRAGAAAASLANIRPNLEAAQALYASLGGFADALRGARAAGRLDRAIREGFVAVFAQLDAIEAPLAVAVEDPAGRAQVAALIAELRRCAAGRRAAGAGARPSDGFNAFDGDS